MPHPPIRVRAALIAALIPVCAHAQSRPIHLDIKSLDRDRVLKAADEYLKEKPVTITTFQKEVS